MRFVDTNVLLYAVSSDEREVAKSERARQILNEPDLALSVQVLQEFYVQATRATAAAPLSPDDAEAFVTTLLRFPVQDVTVRLMHMAMGIKARWQLSYWDAAILAAAHLLGCDTVLSEDLQDGQDFDGVRVTNPFLA